MKHITLCAQESYRTALEAGDAKYEPLMFDTDPFGGNKCLFAITYNVSPKLQMQYVATTETIRRNTRPKTQRPALGQGRDGLNIFLFRATMCLEPTRHICGASYGLRDLACTCLHFAIRTQCCILGFPSCCIAFQGRPAPK